MTTTNNYTCIELIEAYIEEHDVDLANISDVLAFCRDIYRWNPSKSVASLRRTFYEHKLHLQRQAKPEDKDAPPEEPQGLSALERDYFYNELDDVYIIWLPGKMRPAKIEGDIVREMKRAYSNWVGRGETINSVATRFGWKRKDFESLKATLGWTHGDDPFTDEEMATRTTQELLEDYASQKRGEFERALKKQEWQETVEQAKKWRELEEKRVIPLAEYITTNPPRAREELPLKLSQEPQQEVLHVYSPSDMHIGKLAVDGYNTDVAVKRALNSTARLAERLVSAWNTNKCVLLLGNDQFHVDNPKKTTTAGTPQDFDGLPGTDYIRLQYFLSSELIDTLRCYYEHVEVRVVPSNHGGWSDMHLYAGLEFAYKDYNDVSVVGDADFRQYSSFGKTMLCIEHGHGTPKARLCEVMANEAPELWGKTRYRYALVGHRHHVEMQDRGVVILQAPSMSGVDRWHHSKGYTASTKSNVAYAFCKEQGLVAQLFDNF